MKTFKLCAVAALGLMAFGVGNMQAQVGRLPFQFGDVQSLNISLKGVMQATNYNNGTKDIAKIKTGKLDNKGLLGLIGQAYRGDANAFVKAGKTNYMLQIYLASTNGDFESDYWPVQVVQVVGTNKTVVLDTARANAFVPAGQSNAYANFYLEVDNGPLSGQAGEQSGSVTMTGAAYFGFYYYYYINPTEGVTVYNGPFNIYGHGTLKQKFSGNAKGDKYSFTIDNISGQNIPEEDNLEPIVETVLTGGSRRGNGKDNGQIEAPSAGSGFGAGFDELWIRSAGQGGSVGVIDTTLFPITFDTNAVPITSL